MISLNSPDPEPGFAFPVLPAHAIKALAKSTVIAWGGTPLSAKLTKRAALPEAEPGFAVGHEILGYFSEPPIEGQRFMLVRYSTAGREAYGVFDTSPVVAVVREHYDGVLVAWEFTTQNSVYSLELTADPLEGL